MRVSEKEHKKLKKQFEQKNAPSKQVIRKVKEETLPDWFDKNLENEEMTEEEQRELEQILNSISS